MPGSRVQQAQAEAAAEAADLLAALGCGASIDLPAVVVAAHPDDETISMGARLATFADLTLVHLTEGAPEAPEDALRAGFADRTAYAEARARELDEALAKLGIAPRRVRLNLRDQQLVLGLPFLARALAKLLAKAELVITHAYEGGHPDHDAAAFAVQSACRLLRRSGRRAPIRLEFAGYHQRDGRRETGCFWPDPARPAIAARIEAGALARKQAALAAHQTQAEVIAWFDPAAEAYREAPDYDFDRPPPPGAALYDDFGWALTSRIWREHARAALSALGLEVHT